MSGSTETPSLGASPVSQLNGREIPYAHFDVASILARRYRLAAAGGK